MTESPNPDDHSDADGASVSSPPELKAVAIEELKPFLVPGNEEAVGARVEAIVRRESYKGPIPPAREFARYDEALPGAADRILSMAEREQEHRHQLENKLVSTEGSLKKWGQRFALAALAAMLVVVAYFAYNGAANAGAWLGGAVIAAVVALFLGNQYFERKEEEEPKKSVEAPPPAVARPSQKNGQRQNDRNRHRGNKRG